jgi:hypothetical protein
MSSVIFGSLLADIYSYFITSIGIGLICEVGLVPGFIAFRSILSKEALSHLTTSCILDAYKKNFVLCLRFITAAAK